jgi:phosphate transport system substrate-binding protein
MRKLLKAILIIAIAMFVISGCSDETEPKNSNTDSPTNSNSSENQPNETPNANTEKPADTEKPANTSNFDSKKDITVVSREPGSGTRGAFIEILGIEVKDADGNKTDRTTDEAIIADKTDLVLTNVENEAYAIGYISLGSLKNSVKAVNIDGVACNVDNVKNGTYAIQRPFNIAYKGDLSGVAEDFVNFIFSKEGQDIITVQKFIAIDENASAFESSMPSGKLVVGGSSSVYPVMEKLIEAYEAINSGADIELLQSDSSIGMSGAIDGSYDIGMASRELKDSESAELNEKVIAIDGIAVIVNNDNPLNNLNKDLVTEIFIGDKTKWNEF